MDHATIQRWVVKDSTLVEEAFHRRKLPVWVSWRMDETYIKIRGCFTGVDVLACLRGRDNERSLAPFSASGRTVQHEINTYETPSVRASHTDLPL